jgi:hypothetical protein
MEESSDDASMENEERAGHLHDIAGGGAHGMTGFPCLKPAPPDGGAEQLAPPAAPQPEGAVELALGIRDGWQVIQTVFTRKSSEFRGRAHVHQNHGGPAGLDDPPSRRQVSHGFTAKRAASMAE